MEIFKAMFMIKTIFVLSTIVILLVVVIPSQALAFTIVDSDRPISETSEWVRYIEHGPYKAIANVKLTTFSDPGVFETDPNYPGVAKLILKNGPTYLCTGTLLNDQQHILTAAHCVTNSKTGAISLKSGYAEFTNPNGSKSRFNIDASQTFVPAAWDTNYLKGNDFAILKLFSSVSYTGYTIDSSLSGDLGLEVYKVGFGRSGQGEDGDVLSAGTKRNGSNQYDATHDIMMTALGYSFIPGAVLQYDFDNGLDANDAFGVFFDPPYSLANTNTFGGAEVNSASGDSGGPTFDSDGKITGVTSYGITLTWNNGTTSDFTSGLDSSFGEFSGDTRVAHFAGLIDLIVPGASGIPVTNNPAVAVDDGTTSLPFATTDEDTPTDTLNVLANDSDDDGDTFTVSSYQSTSSKGASISHKGDGIFSYDPSSSSELNALVDSESVTDTFTYSITDGISGTSTATVTIGVVGVDDIIPPGPSVLNVSFQNEGDDGDTTYVKREMMHIFGFVTDGGNLPVENASVIVKLLGANGRVGEFKDTYMTDEFGQIHIHYKVQINRFGEGTNYIFGDASFGTTTTNCLRDDSSCHSVFTTVSGSPNSKNSQKP